MIRRPPRSTQGVSSAASDVYKRQSLKDANGNRIGDPTGQTLASLFFDHDSDGDVDLWLADDGDTLRVYRNDTDGDDVAFVSVGEEMGVDSVGAWMGFALGDYDSDEDLDIFVTNIGYHFLLYDVPPVPSGDCAYSHAYGWGTCYHLLLQTLSLIHISEPTRPY